MPRPVCTAAAGGWPDSHATDKPGGEEQRHLDQVDPDQPAIALERDVEAIAQNVLGVALIDAEPRQLGLVHQDPADVAPEETGERAVRIGLLVGELMMAAVDRDPARRGLLQAGHRDHHHRMLQPFRHLQAAMGEEPVVAKVDAEQPAQVGEQHGEDQAAPGEPAGHEGQQRQGMVAGDHDDIGPVELERPHARGQRYPACGGEGGNMVRGGQNRWLDGRHFNRRHGGGGSHLCARPSSAEQPVPDIGCESPHRTKPLTEFVYFS